MRRQAFYILTAALAAILVARAVVMANAGPLYVAELGNFTAADSDPSDKGADAPEVDDELMQDRVEDLPGTSRPLADQMPLASPIEAGDAPRVERPPKPRR